MLEIIIIGLVTLVGIITHSILGFGVAFFLTPAFLFFFDPPTAILLSLLVGNTICTIILVQERYKLELKWTVIAAFILSAIPGTLLGSVALTRIDKGLLQIIIGALIIAGIIIQEYVFPKPRRNLSFSSGLVGAGLLSGVSNALAAMAAPPLVIGMRSRIATPNQIRHNLAVTFLIINTMSIGEILSLRPDSLSAYSLTLLAVLVPVIGAGYWLGRVLAKKLNLKQYHAIVFYVVIIAGAATIIAGLTSL